MSAENPIGQSRRDPCGTELDDSGMVPKAHEDAYRETSALTQGGQPLATFRYSYTTPIAEKDETNSISIIMNSLQNRGFSNSAAHIIMASWRTKSA